MIKGKVLIVEDQDYIAELLKDVFEIHKIEALCALDGQTAIKIVQTESIDLLVLDLSLPDSNGIELYQKIVAIKPHLANRVIFMSGYDPEGYFYRFLQVNPVKFLPKPFTIKEISALIQDFI
jgi:DNA-binding response OmpR family regulator